MPRCTRARSLVDRPALSLLSFGGSSWNNPHSELHAPPARMRRPPSPVAVVWLGGAPHGGFEPLPPLPSSSLALLGNQQANRSSPRFSIRRIGLRNPSSFESDILPAVVIHQVSYHQGLITPK